ncbi:hypothetical protein PoB_006539500 [Plakobranchus ocellatus]|uniref:Uncharacterized protein n=1 Tax=Plakobranchus ocellatus TaxID=259542 RepID=A0AAV4D420_9GAST|nr:hypothetical protein PoB_006539500 [Plakobranchus ocellatus]
MLRKLQPCALPRQVYNAVRNIFLRLLSRSASEASLKILSTGYNYIARKVTVLNYLRYYIADSDSSHGQPSSALDRESSVGLA